jgi:HlyD family secretion protein
MMRRTDCQPLGLLVMVWAALAGLTAGCGWFAKTDDTQSQTQTRGVYALGRLEPAGGIISISAIPGERLQQLDPDVQENQLAPANGILGLLASYEVVKPQLKALEKKKDLAEKKREQEIELVKAQRAQAEAARSEAVAKQSALPLQEQKLDLLEVASRLAQAEHRRLVELSRADPELVSRHQLAKQKNEMQLAAQERDIAAERVVSAKDATEKAVAAADANIRVADLSLAQLEQGFDTQAIAEEMEVAKETLKQSVLLAPDVPAGDLPNVLGIHCVKDHEFSENEEATDKRPYTVLKVFLRPGEFITQTPILQLGDLRQMVCIAELYEADVKEIIQRQGVTIRSPSFSKPFADGEEDPVTKRRQGGMRGTVERIGGMIAPPGLANRNPLAPADRSVVEVRITIDDPAAVKQARSLVGLQVTVEFDKNDDPQATAEGEASHGGDAN